MNFIGKPINTDRSYLPAICRPLLGLPPENGKENPNRYSTGWSPATRLRDAIAEAYCERWRLDYQRLKQRRDVAVQNFRRYPALAEELINLFAEALRRRIHRLLQQEVKKDKYGPLSFSVVVICW